MLNYSETRTDASTDVRSSYINSSRIQALDLQRGFIMLIMALSHCLEYLGPDAYTNLDWNTPASWAGSSFLDKVELFFVTAVAPGFFMLMGIGILFFHQARLKEGWSEAKICRFLCFRGLLLALLQLTILQCFEILAEQKIYFYAGVLLTLGLCMMAAALLLFCAQKLKALPYLNALPILSLLALTSIGSIMLSSQSIIDHLHQGLTHPSLWNTVFFLGGHYNETRLALDINFTPLPWFPAVALGLLLGQLLLSPRKNKFNLIGLLAVVLLAAWFGLRYANLHGLVSFGSYKNLLPNESLSFTTYFCMSKYPPSFTYFLWTLAFNLVCIFLLSEIENLAPRFINFLQPVKLFGQCALFFFVAHWFIYYGLSLLIQQKLHSTLWAGAAWLTGLMILYPLCKAFNAFKLKQPKESVWRMF